MLGLYDSVSMKKKKKGNKTPISGPYANFRGGVRITSILQGGCKASEKH